MRFGFLLLFATFALRKWWLLLMLKAALERCLPACLQVTGKQRRAVWCKIEVTVSLSFSSHYYQLIYINRPYCCKFLMNKHWLACLFLLPHFLPCLSCVHASASAFLFTPPFPHACDATIWLLLSPSIQCCSSADWWHSSSQGTGKNCHLCRDRLTKSQFYMVTFGPSSKELISHVKNLM